MFQESILVTHIIISTNTEMPNSASDTTLELEDARKSLGTQPIEMADEELTYTKEAKQKHAANVVQQEFAQCTHRKDPPRNKKINQSAQPANKQQVEGNHPLSLQPLCSGENLPPKEEESANRKKVKKAHPLQHQWKVRSHHITTC